MPNPTRLPLLARALARSLVILVALWSAGAAQARDDGVTDYLTAPAGSYVIDMGHVTVAAGLKPYGMVYDMIINHQVPLWWAIDPNKVKDGVDFSYDGKSYRAGSFVISGDFVTPGVVAAVAEWRAVGVVVDGPVPTPIAGIPVYDVLTSWPRAVLDLQNGKIAAAYFVAAGVPSAYYRLGLPSALTSCDDLYVMPHADPAWSTHSNLLPFNASGGAFWAGCHAVSVVENITNPDDPSQSLGFLMNDGAVLFGDHKDGTRPPPYVYREAAHPIMQFLGLLDDGTDGGSEQIFLPASAGWRSAARVSVFDDSHPNVPSLSPGEAAVVVFGRGFGSSTNGYVMYEAGHNQAGSGPQEVAAQRAFFNFVLMAGIDRRPEINTSHAVSHAVSLEAGETIELTSSVTGGTGPFTYQWTSSGGGTFSDPTSPTTSFTAPAATVDTSIVLRLVVIDACGRFNFEATVAAVKGLPDLVLTKTSSAAEVPTNEAFSYELTVTNAGSDATLLQLVDEIPAGVTYLGFSDPDGDGWSCSASGSSVTCTLAALAKSAGARVVLNVTAPPEFSEAVNTASVWSAEPDVDPTNNTASATTAFRPATDLLFVSKTVDPLVIDIGASATYTLRVRNDGPLDATTVIVTDVLPEGLTFVSADGAGWGCGYAPVSRAVTCVRPSLASGVTAPDVEVIVTAANSIGNPFVNTAEVGSPDVADLDPTNDTASASLAVQASAELRLIKSTNKPDAGNGNALRFYLDVTNLGPDTATNVRIVDTLPYTANGAAPPDGFREFCKGDNFWFTGPAGTRVQGTNASRTFTVNGVTFSVSFVGIDCSNINSVNPITNPAPGTLVQVVWTLTPGLASGQSVQVEFEAKRTGSTQTLLNTGTATSDLADPQPANNTDVISLTTGVKESDLQVTKTDLTDPVQANANFTYRLHIQNNGPDNLNDLDKAASLQDPRVVDVLPPGTQMVSYVIYRENSSTTIGRTCVYDPLADGFACTVNDNNHDWLCSYDSALHALTCDWNDNDNQFENGQSHYIDITLKAPNRGDVITNTATVSYLHTARIDNADHNDTDTETTTILPPPVDLAVTKGVTPAVPTYGGTVTFTVTVFNDPAGFAIPATATSLSLVDPLPAGLTLLTRTLSQGVAAGDVWYVGDLAPGATATMTITARVDTLAAVTNTASLGTLDQIDVNAANDSASVIVNVPDADLALVKTATDLTPDFGSTVTYALTLTNLGPDAAVASVTDVLPLGLALDLPMAFVASAGSAVYDPVTRVVSWTGVALGPSASATLTFPARVVTVNDVTNTARIATSTLPDPVAANDQSTVVLAVQSADLGVTKGSWLEDLVGRPGQPDPGDRVTYLVTIHNAGRSDATNVTVTDPVPAGVTYLSHVAPGGTTYDPTSGTWTIPALAVDAELTLEVTVELVAYGTIRNVATIVTADQVDPNLNDNTAEHVILSGGEADLSITKSVDDNQPYLGETVTFDIAITNYGPDVASNVVVRDLLPSGLAYAGHVAPPGTAYDPVTGDWSIPEIANGARFVLEVSAVVRERGVIVNMARVQRLDQGDPDDTNDTFSVFLAALEEADLELVKRVDVAEVLVGESVTFTVEIVNRGPGIASLIRVVDELPLGLTIVDPLADVGTNKGSASYDPSTHSVTWSVGSLLAGDPPYQLTIRARVDAQPPLTNLAEIVASNRRDPDSTPGNGILGEDDDASVTLVIRGVTVAGRVYHDVDTDGTPDIDESWDFAADGVTPTPTMYAHLVDSATGLVLRSATVSTGTGTYAFLGVTAGGYRIVASAVLIADGDPLPAGGAPSGWLFVSPAAGVLPLSVTDVPIGDADVGLFHGSLVSGTVFRDDGHGAGVSADGVLQGSEAGIPSAVVTASDALASVSTVTTADGTYRIYLPATFGVEVTLSHSLPVPTGTSVAGASADACLETAFRDGGAASRLLGDVDCSLLIDGGETGFTAGTVYAGYDFGVGRASRFIADQFGSVASPGTIEYVHLYTPGMPGAVTFAADADAFTYLVFVDADCDGVDDPDEGALEMPATIVVGPMWPRLGDGALAGCAVRVRVIVPDGVVDGFTDIAAVTASLVWSTNPHAVTDTTLVIDTTRVSSSGGLSLAKEVCNVTEGCVYDVAGQGRPGDVLEYRVTFTNRGIDDVSDLVVYDPVPFYTTISLDQYGVTGELEFTCPDGSVVAVDIGEVAGIAVDVSTVCGIAVLRPGESGSLRYRVTID
ncbi:MAG: hypothetical protein ACNA8N_05955 [Trueperaceae bacterium]